MSRRSEANYVPALTGVRAMAAYLVFISHFCYIFDDKFPHLLQRFFGEFHIGVSIFFVLSGFLITFRYYDNFHLTGEWFKQYLKNRVARIYPMYALLTIAAFAYYFITKDQIITQGHDAHPVWLLILNITFLRGFFYQIWNTGISQGWSLTVEECFYFSAPIIFLIAKKYHKFYIQPVIITAFAVSMYLIFHNVNFHGFFGNIYFVLLYTFFGRCFEFFVGVQLAKIILKKGLVRKIKFHFTYTSFIMIFVCVLIMATQTPVKPWIAGLESPVGVFVNNYILCICVAGFFYGLLTEDTIFKRFLALPFIELLGKSSYIFYLIHLGWMEKVISGVLNSTALNNWFYSLYDKWGVDWHSPFEYDSLNLLIVFVVLNAISITLFKLIEEPVNHAIRRSNFLVPYKPRPQGIVD